jgi:hypothetical protein
MHKFAKGVKKKRRSSAVFALKLRPTSVRESVLTSYESNSSVELQNFVHSIITTTSRCINSLDDVLNESGNANSKPMMIAKFLRNFIFTQLVSNRHPE